jgi:hypothetical protein
MTAVSNQMRDAGAILPAVDAVTNHRALLVEFSTLAVGVVLLALFASMAMKSMSVGAFGAGYLLFVLFAGIGFNAAGVVLMDEAAGAPRRSFADVLLAGAFAFGKAIAVFLLAGLGAIVVLLAVALLLWICRIPGVGPVLFFVVFPASAIVLGVLWAAFAFVLAPIAGPAIWSGESIGAALARVMMVIRKRLLGVLVRGCVLFLLLVVTAMVLWTIAFTGSAVAGALSLGIVGVDFDLSSIAGAFGGGAAQEFNPYARPGMRPGMRMTPSPPAAGTGGYGVAMLVSLGLIAAAVGTLLSLVLKKGWCLIYLQTARDLDVSAVEAEMQAKLAQVRAQAQAARERVQQQNQAAQQAGREQP